MTQHEQSGLALVNSAVRKILCLQVQHELKNLFVRRNISQLDLFLDSHVVYVLKFLVGDWLPQMPQMVECSIERWVVVCSHGSFDAKDRMILCL